MKITLTYTEEEKSDALLAIHAFGLKRVIDDLRDKIRVMYKYEDKHEIPLEELRDLIWEIIKENECEHLWD